MKPCVFAADFVFAEGALRANAELCVDAQGQVVAQPVAGAERVRLEGRAIIPGMVNAHSHAFQRVIRARTQHLTPGREHDDFWSWREAMYDAANALSPEGLYAASRQTFLEMALAGITTVGEFHYLHHQSDGTPYDDVHTLAHQVIRAAREIGLRIVLLRVGYARAGFGKTLDPRQRRFIEPDAATFLQRSDGLRRLYRLEPLVSVGLAPHSVRAVPKGWLEDISQVKDAPVHIHCAEQPAEVDACVAEHRLRPLELLDSVGLLSPRLTAVHAIHLSDSEIARAGAATINICACPSTERDLGDGVVPADALLQAGVQISLGSDSQAQVDLLDEARQLEGHLRLSKLKRAVLDPRASSPAGLAARLLSCATHSGARSLGVSTGNLAPGESADFAVIDLRHVSLRGATQENVLAHLVFASGPSAVRDVYVQGSAIVQQGHHALEQPVGEAFTQLMNSL